MDWIRFKSITAIWSQSCSPACYEKKACKFILSHKKKKNENFNAIGPANPIVWTCSDLSYIYMSAHSNPLHIHAQN